ncbi:MAG: L,D-transpeptidase family protein [Parvularcula sp.]|jgi:murein L,D-transpeptidase YcbB/YkuD|nr:L,D-transpeptidase family protein [Parvularcula sp.]
MNRVDLLIALPAALLTIGMTANPIPGTAAPMPAPGSVASYYVEGGEPLWHGSRQARKRLRNYLTVLESLPEIGLDPIAYDGHIIATLVRQRAWRQLEATASDSFSRLATDLADGAISAEIDFTEEELAGRSAKKAEFLERLQRGENPDDLLEDVASSNPLQDGLIAALKRYRRYAAEDAFQEVSLSGDILEEGDSGEDVVAVAERLRAEGFLTLPLDRTEDGEALFGPVLADALESFQMSRGITPDGIVGPNTLTRMNESEEALVDQLILNIERSRWLPSDFGEQHVFVNIAAYDVAMQKGRDFVAMRTVVGTERNETPVFAAKMSYVVVNPYWNVPESILRAEIAPKAAEDRSYLGSKNYEVVSGWQDPQPYRGRIDWDNLPDNLPFRVRQRPGPTNALGRIKFMFPNDYAVYLHDTPADQLFGEAQRAFSHGCIRLERPLDFADWVFGVAADKAPPIEEILKTGEETRVILDREIPVYVTYMTARAEGETVYFYEDIYDRDQAVLDRLRAGS